MGKTKSFKIGECAIGGIIKIEIIGKIIKISALDWYTKEVVRTGTTLRFLPDAQRHMNEFLHELTTSYHADKAIEWIKSKIKLECEDEYYKYLNSKLTN